MVKELTVETFEAEALKSSVPVLVKFWASWCGPCTSFAPTFEAVSQEVPDCVFGSINVNEQEALAMEYEVNMIPTVILLKNGKIVDRTEGMLTKDMILSLLSKNS